MPGGIIVSNRIIPHITEAIQVLWIVLVWHDGVWAQKAVDIRRRQLFYTNKKVVKVHNESKTNVKRDTDGWSFSHQV